MGILTKMRKQAAVLWSFTGSYDSSGTPIWDSPEEVLVRWEESSEVDAASETTRYKADVYLGQDLRTGDYLMLGALQSNTSEDPRDEESWEVQSFEKVPNLRAREFLRIAHASPAPLTLLAKHGRGVEAVTFSHAAGASVSAGIVTQSTTDTAVPVALRGQPDTAELQQVSGRSAGTMVAWELPKKDVPEPGLEDYLTDSSGVRWNVVSFGEGKVIRTWWRFMTKRA